jgi:hypothetical protein
MSSCGGWLLAQKPWIIPIPGTRKLDRREENLGAAEIELTPEDLREIESVYSKITVQGTRLSEGHRGNQDSGYQCGVRAHAQERREIPLCDRYGVAKGLTAKSRLLRQNRTRSQ